MEIKYEESYKGRRYCVDFRIETNAGRRKRKKKASEPDGIPNVAFNTAIITIPDVFTYIYNACFMRSLSKSTEET